MLPASFENNLLNVTNRDAVFQRAQRLLSELVSERLTDEARALFAATPQLGIAAADNYFLHYTLFPRLRAENPDQLLGKILSFQREYVKSQDFSRARAITVHSHVFSAIHSIAFTKRLVELLLEELRRRMPQEQLQQLLQQLQQAAGAGGGQQQGQGGGQQQQQGGAQPQQQGEGGQQPQQQQQPSADAQQALQQLSSALADALDKGTFDEALRAAEKAARTARDLDQLAGGRWAGKDEADRLRELLDLSSAVFAVRDAERIVSLAKETVARMPFFTRIRKERDRLGDEIAGYTLTHNLDRALPRELALPEELFETKLASGGLLAREKLTVREGAIYVLIDKSGSMEGSKTVWARSVALALLALARRKGVRFFLRFFDLRPHELVDDSDPARLTRLLLTVASGGDTSIDDAVRTALRDLRERGLERLTNTIVIITDGEDRVTVRKDELRRHGASLVSVMIQGENSTLREISDEYLRAELTTDGALRIVDAVRR